MDIICPHCNAAKFRGETAGMCCSNGIVKLPALEPPPEPLHSLLTGESPTSKHFLQNIQTYNSCFQMTSFGATKIIRDEFMPTFKVITSHWISSETFDPLKIPILHPILLHKHYRFRDKYTIEQARSYHLLMLTINFCKYILSVMKLTNWINGVQLGPA